MQLGRSSVGDRSDERLQRVNRFCSSRGVCTRASSQMGPTHIGAITAVSEARGLIMIRTSSRLP